MIFRVLQFIFITLIIFAVLSLVGSVVLKDFIFTAIGILFIFAASLVFLKMKAIRYDPFL